MTYRVYIDLIFLVNGIMNGIVLAVLNKVLGKKAGLLRIGAAAAAGALWACAAELWLQMPVLFRILGTWLAVPAFMTAVVFCPSGIKELAGEMMGLYLSAAVVEGVMAVLFQHTKVGWYVGSLAAGQKQAALPLLSWILAAAGSGAGAYGLAGMAAEGLKNRIQGRHFCPVVLGFKGKTVRIRGLLDTGNCLREPVSGRPVHVAEANVMLRLCPSVRGVVYVPFRSVGTENGILPAVCIDWMKVKMNHRVYQFERPLIAVYKGALSPRGSYEILLQQEQWEENGKPRRNMIQHTGGKNHDDQGIHTKPISIKNNAGISRCTDAKAE